MGAGLEARSTRAVKSSRASKNLKRCNTEADPINGQSCSKRRCKRSHLIWQVACRAASVLQDFRHALRVLRGSPGVTVAALAALALGIGANTAIFSLMDAVVLRPLPYPQAGRLMSVSVTEKGRAMNTSWPTFRDWQEQTRVFERLAAYTGGSASLTGSGEPIRVNAAQVSPEMFSVLGSSPLVGALDSSAQTAVISYGFWMRRFGGEREALGRTLILDGEPYSLAGVLPNDFRFPRWQMMEEPDISARMCHPWSAQ